MERETRPTRPYAAVTRFTLAASLLAMAGTASATAPPCQPCAGVRVDDPRALLAELSSPPSLEEDERLYLSWPVELDGAARGDDAAAVADVGATPWPRLIFRAAPPLLKSAALETELAAAADVARAATPESHFQIDWLPPDGASSLHPAREYAYLLKRASVVIKGAQPEARVLTGTLSTDSNYLADLYAQDIAAYIEGVVLSAATPEAPGLAAAVARLAELDPGRPVTLVGARYPVEPLEALATAARGAERGFAVNLFDLDEPATVDLDPLKLLASEFGGDVSLDPYSTPSGELDAWSFVRGDDLSLRVIARPRDPAAELVALFPDSQLRRPARFDPNTGDATDLYGIRLRDEGVELSVADPGPVLVLKLDRLTASEIEGMEGLDEQVLVTDERRLPVEEILRRLQAFEDAQSRRLRNYRAINTTHLRYQLGTGGQAIETTFKGPYFVRTDGGFDWVWQEFLINGIRWRSKKIPEIPLIQPEKATVAPIEITFTKEYVYSLRGTATIGGRDCWVVDFEPAAAVEEGKSLFRGTVWVDREIFARVQTRAVQLGLEGNVISNDETISFGPLDRQGNPAPWSAESFVLPLRLVGQQLWSILSATTIVEREVLLTEIVPNAPDFDERLAAALDSEFTMVRDTEEGLRYLVPDDETGERVVKEEVDTSRRFVIAGVFHDDALDFPIPLGGFNWLWFDWRGTGAQANVFFAGPLITVAATQPNIGGSKWDLGLDLFALAVANTDRIFRDGREIDAEDVERINPNVDLKIGRQLGQFGKVDFQYQLGYAKFSRADDTSPEFVLPRDHLNHTFTLTSRYSRRGYRLRARGSHTIRGDWERWGLPGLDEFSPDHDEYTKWNLSVGKIWHLPKFLKFGAELEYVKGSNLDRFSKYEFGFFSNVRVHGYQSDKIRGDEAYALHLNYGFDIGGVFRVDLLGDAAWVTDPTAGFDQELLAGAGLAGTFVGPWRTVISADLGVAVTGPDDGFTAFLAVLKPLG